MHFASRRAMDIEGLGDKLVEQLVDAGIVRTRRTSSNSAMALAGLSEWGKIGDEPAGGNRSQPPHDAGALRLRARHPQRRRDDGKGSGRHFGSLDRILDADGRADDGSRCRAGGGALYCRISCRAA